MQSPATTVSAYLSELPDERKTAISRVRAVIRKHLPAGFSETMQYGMISYVVPLSKYPDTYNGQPLAVIALASQKNHMAVYLMGIYGSTELRKWFEAAYAKSGKRLDAGKSCVRFKHLEDLALDAVAGAVEKVSVSDLIAMSESAHGKPKPKPTPKKSSAKTKTRRAK